MEQHAVEAALANLPIPAVRYYDRVGSTNDEAIEWAAQGADDLSLVVADEQTHGRGRAGRKWYTPAGSALAFSLVMHPPPRARWEMLPRLPALGALAACEALTELYGLTAQIKWPNDVLLEGRKFAGVLAEAHWLGEELHALILGIGMNVAVSAIPPASELDYPATCVERILGQTVDRLTLLRSILERAIHWRSKIASGEFLQAWETHLAFVGGLVEIMPQSVRGVLTGLNRQGHLCLRTQSGEEIAIPTAEAQLRPVDRLPD